MASSYNFRSALNGFHREDVVHYLEYVNSKNARQLAQLQADLDAARKENAQLRENQLEKSRYEELEQENASLAQQLQALQEELAAVQAQKVQEIQHSEEELEAYRRAEWMERQTRQRAQQLCQRANGILADAGTKVEASANCIGAMADQVASQLQVLREAVLDSKAALQEASTAIYTLRPEEE